MSEIAEKLQNDWIEFKVKNDARLAEIEKFGAATAETNQQVGRINDSISAYQNRLDELETRVNRPLAGGFNGAHASNDEQMRLYARWQSVAQNKAIEPEQVDLQFIKDYSKGFRNFMRHGDTRILNEMSVASPPDGGFLVTPDVTGKIAKLLTEMSPIRRLASVQEISSDTLEGTNDLDVAGAGWVGETQVRPGNTATPQVGTWRIPLHEMYAEPNASQKLLDDAMIDVEAWLAGKVSTAFSMTENTGFVSGNGVLQPRGFTTYPNGIPTAALWNVVQRVVSGAAALLTGNGLINLVFSLKSPYRQGSVFGMNRMTEAAVRLLVDGQGNYLWQPDFQQRSAASLLGFPIEDMPDLANVAAGTLPIAFGNFATAYQIIDRGGIRVLRDPYTRKGFVKFYTTKRTGGDLTNFEAIKLQVVSV